MQQKILDVLRLGTCSHEFSWPRRGPDRNYYQVCVQCGVEYEYDWAAMRRTRRVQLPTPETGIRRNHPREKNPSWKPRARRVKFGIPLRYRVNKTSAWFEGAVENISQSGVLFQGQEQLPLNALLEMVFEMPEEISGQKNSNVMCQGRVMRSDAVADPNAHPAPASIGAAAAPVILAASIIDYKFIR
jgi:hypothetical protein